MLGVLFLLLGAALLWFFIRHRALFLPGSQRSLDAPIQSLGALNWTLLSGALAASFLLVAGFVLWPVALPQWLGAPSSCSWVLPGSCSSAPWC